MKVDEFYKRIDELPDARVEAAARKVLVSVKNCHGPVFLRLKPHLQAYALHDDARLFLDRICSIVLGRLRNLDI